MKAIHQRWEALGLALAAVVMATANAWAETVLRAVMNFDLKIIDPIWTTVYATRNYGYMVYDTLYCAQREARAQTADEAHAQFDAANRDMG
jgi:hypothetical protein